MENIKSTIAWLAPPYGVLIASIYLYGYWSTFDINLFEYTTISEMLLVALVPSLFGFMAMGIGWVLVSFEAKLPNDKERAIKNSTDVDCNTSILRKTVVYGVFFITLAWSSGVHWAMLFILVVPITGCLNMLPQFKEIQNVHLRIGITLLLVVAPIASFVSAKSKALNITRGEKYWSVTVDAKNYRYVGHAGNKTFLIDNDNKLVLILPDSDERLSLSKIEDDSWKKQYRANLFKWFN